MTRRRTSPSKAAARSEIPLTGGELNRVVRVGNTVRRPVGPWTPAVHGLLRHLEMVGYRGTPKVLGFDERGREVLTFIEGQPATRPWPPALRTDEGLRALVSLLRAYHDAVADYVPPVDSVWAAGAMRLRPGEIVRHGDFGPWNTIWYEGRPVALIDFDLAEPGSRLQDLAQAALFTLPLQGPTGAELAGFASPPDLNRRLLVLCEAYGSCQPGEVLDGVHEFVATEISRVQRLAELGQEPWVTLRANGKVAEFREYQHWLPATLDELRP